MTLSERLQHARDVNARLMRPPNAKPDTGINMKNGHVIPIMCQDEVQVFVPVINPTADPSADVFGPDLDPLAVFGPVVCRLEKIIPVRRIQTFVAEQRELTRNDIISDRRQRSVVTARHIAMYLTKELTPLSLAEIGRRFGGKDHTTVRHAVLKLKDIKERDSIFAAVLDTMADQLRAQ